MAEKKSAFGTPLWERHLQEGFALIDSRSAAIEKAREEWQKGIEGHRINRDAYKAAREAYDAKKEEIKERYDREEAELGAKHDRELEEYYRHDAHQFRDAQSRWPLLVLLKSEIKDGLSLDFTEYAEEFGFKEGMCSSITKLAPSTTLRYVRGRTVKHQTRITIFETTHGAFYGNGRPDSLRGVLLRTCQKYNVHPDIVVLDTFDMAEDHRQWIQKTTEFDDLELGPSLTDLTEWSEPTQPSLIAPDPRYQEANPWGDDPVDPEALPSPSETVSARLRGDMPAPDNQNEPPPSADTSDEATGPQSLDPTTDQSSEPKVWSSGRDPSQPFEPKK